MDLTLFIGGDFFMGKTGRTNNSYSEDLKMQAVQLALEGNISYREVARQLGIRNKTQVDFRRAHHGHTSFAFLLWLPTYDNCSDA